MIRLSLTLVAGASALALAGCANDMAMNDDMSASTTTTASTNMSTRGSMSSTRAMANPTVGGAAMYSNKTIVENAMNSPIHTTLVKAVTAAGLVDTLSGPGPFTVFAPTDKAFSYQSPQTMAALMDPANKDQLTKVLTYHVVPGVYTTQDLMAKIKAGGGKAMLTTVNGADLTLMMEGPNIVVMGANGSKGYINPTERNVRQSNGIIQVINGVLLPPMGAM